MNDEPLPLRLRPERVAALECARCGGMGVVLVGPPALYAKRCQCAAGLLPGLWTGPIHPDDWAELERKPVQNIGGKNVAITA